jgi:hypothetical protein
MPPRQLFKVRILGDFQRRSILVGQTYEQKKTGVLHHVIFALLARILVKDK